MTVDRGAKLILVQTVAWGFALLLWCLVHFGETELAAPVGAHLLGVAVSLRALGVRQDARKVTNAQYAFLATAFGTLVLWFVFVLTHGQDEHHSPPSALLIVLAVFISVGTMGYGVALLSEFRLAKLQAELGRMEALAAAPDL